jgi:hypothetical protein
MPALVLGVEYATIFWQESWYLVVLFALVLGLLDGYFIFQWKLFVLLENEDWAGLKNFVHKKLFEKNRFTQQNVHLYVNACLMSNDLQGIDRLSTHMKTVSFSSALKHAPQLGVPVLLRHDGKEIFEWFGEFWNKSKEVGGPQIDIDPWIGWDYAFGLLLLNKHDEARDVLVDIYRRTKGDSMLRLLTVYMMKGFQDEEVLQLVTEFTDDLRKRYTPDTWAAKIEKQKDTVQRLVLHSIAEEASSWVFGINPKEKK